MRLNLYRVPGESPKEVVFYRTFRTYTFWIKHEYSSAPWEWHIVDGKVPIAFGDELTQEAAEERLTAAVAEYCPSFGDPPDERPPGLLRRLWRAI